MAAARSFLNVPIDNVVYGTHLAREITSDGVQKQIISFKLNGQMPNHPVLLFVFRNEDGELVVEIGAGNHRVKGWEKW